MVVYPQLQYGTIYTDFVLLQHYCNALSLFLVYDDLILIMLMCVEMFWRFYIQIPFITKIRLHLFIEC